MRWKQFFTPVQSIDVPRAQQIIDENPQGMVTILDVRQPKEYRNGHLPGATLIPLAEIRDRMTELDPDKPTVVYCAIGGRSRVAAQMLSAGGFREVYNLSGGFKAWDGLTAVGPVDRGLELFSGGENVEEVLVAAYALEKGLMDFYERMREEVAALPVRKLFHKLAAIEVSHQQRLLSEYNRITGTDFSPGEFTGQIASPDMEGGLTTGEYLQLFAPDLDSPSEVIGLAMSIEAQALDMYHRASEQARDPDSRKELHQIAVEEQQHLKLLGELLDSM